MRFIILMLVGALATGTGWAQGTGPSGAGAALSIPTNGPSVSLWLPHQAMPAHAPARVPLFARVAPVPDHPSTTVHVSFYAGSQCVGVRDAVWHNAIRPDPHSPRPQPMIVAPAGFGITMCIWSNAPAGDYRITARATWADGWMSVSTPVSFNILP